MTSQNFCYWLQGHFELNGATGLNKDQVELIVRHCDLVFTYDGMQPFPDPTPTMAFVRELHTSLTMLHVVHVSSQGCAAIASKLNGLFKHEIDTPDPTGALQAAHDGTTSLSPAEIAKLPYWDPNSPNYDPHARC